MNKAEQIFCRDALTDERFILRSSDLVRNHSHLFYPQVVSETFHIVISLNASRTGLNHNDELIHSFGGAAAKMLKACLHIQNNHIVTAKDQMVDDTLEQIVTDAKEKKENTPEEIKKSGVWL